MNEERTSERTAEDKIALAEDLAENFLDEFFRFKIGEVLDHASRTIEGPTYVTSLSDKGLTTLHETPWRYMVIERLIQQCHGGVQKIYRCRCVQIGNGKLGQPQLVDLTEVDLRRVGPIEPVAVPANPPEPIE